MTLIIELNPVEEERISAAAEREGIAPSELAKRVLATHLPQIGTAANTNGQGPVKSKRDPAHVAQVRKIRGKFAHSEPLASDELHRERQLDREREDRAFRGSQS